MNRNEFDKWLEKIKNRISEDKDVTFDYDYLQGKTYVIDKSRDALAVAKCSRGDTYDPDVGRAIAYAHLKGIKVPEWDSESDYKRVDKGEPYWSISSYLGEMTVIQNEEDGKPFSACSENFVRNNYFKTGKEAKMIAQKLNFLLKLQRFHEIYCPDHKPSPENKNERKYYISYSPEEQRYAYDGFCRNFSSNDICFPTAEIAKEICEILNRKVNE